MMSAPAAARAPAIASPMPRRHPVTRATLPVRSNGPGTGSAIAAGPAIDQNLDLVAAFERVEGVVDVVQGHDAGDQVVCWDAATGDQVDGAFHVGAFIDP